LILGKLALQGILKSVTLNFMERGEYAVEFEADGVKHSVNWLFRPPDKTKKDETKKSGPKGPSRGFSGGWIRVAQDHELLMGDAVLFQKLGRQKFKLHIFRRRDFGGNVKRTAEAAGRLGEQLDDLAGGAKKGATGGSSSALLEKAPKQVKRAVIGRGLDKKEDDVSELVKRRRAGEGGCLTEQRQQKLTDAFPVVKKAKVGLLRGLPGKGAPAKIVSARGEGATAGGTEVPAGSGDGASWDLASGSSGGKRVKHTPKRSDSGGGLGKGKRSLVEVDVIPRQHGPAKKAKVGKAADGRLVHCVDRGHRYVEASDDNQRKARIAAENCRSSYPSMCVALSKSKVDKGFWLVSGDLAREKDSIMVQSHLLVSLIAQMLAAGSRGYCCPL
jgi:hypothetical protein